MDGMGALLALLTIVILSLIVVRVGAMALMMTGLSWDTASFQSYSAFFGVGFTTSEAELVVNHPVRRRIIRDLILAGNIGFTSAVATLIVTFFQARGTLHVLVLLLLIVGGALAFYFILRIGLLRQVVDRLIRYTLERAGMVHALDYELLLRVESGYCISEVEILPGSTLDGRTLREARPSDRGLIVLGVTGRDGEFTGIPGADYRLSSGEVATVYGKEDVIHQLSREGKPLASPESDP